MSQRPAQFRINRNSPLAKNLLFAGLGTSYGCLSAFDSSVYGNHAALTNMDPATDWVWDSTLGRWCLDYDQSDDYCLTPTIAHGIGTGDWTMAAWVYPTNFAGGGWAGVMANRPYAPGLYAAGSGGTKIHVYFGTTFVGNTTISINNRWHIAAVRKAGVLSLYLGGKLDNTPAACSASMADAAMILGSSNTLGERFAGRIADPIFAAEALDWALPELADPSNAMLKVAGRPLILPPRRIVFPAVVAPTAYTMTADSGSYSLTGQSSGLTTQRLLSATQGAYTLSGQAASLPAARKLAPDQGSYALGGQSLTMRVQRKVSPDQGEYTLTGQVTGLLTGRRVVPDQGSYGLTGQALNLQIARKLPADYGAYSLTGLSAGLLYGPGVFVETGSYTLSGETVDLLREARLLPEAGAYSLAGQTIGFVLGKFVTLAPGSYTLAGEDATLTYTPITGYTLEVDAGVFTLTGQAVGFSRDWVLVLSMGSYAVSGQVVALSRVGIAWGVEAAGTFVAGMAQGQAFTAGLVQGQTFTAGAAAGKIGR